MIEPEGSIICLLQYLFCLLCINFKSELKLKGQIKLHIDDTVIETIHFRYIDFLITFLKLNIKSYNKKNINIKNVPLSEDALQYCWVTKIFTKTKK